MFDSRNKNRRPRRSSGSSGGEYGDIDPSLLAPGDKPLHSYIDETGTRRVVVGETDGEVFDPQAEIYEPKGETFNVDLARQKPVKTCRQGGHDLQPEGEPGEDIPNTQSMKCTRCPYGEYHQVK